jgi:hypothetical protein
MSAMLRSPLHKRNAPRIVRVGLSFLLGLASLFLGPAEEATSIPAGHDRYNPGRWAPNHVYSILTNSGPSDHDVNYWMKWYYPSFWIEDTEHADYGAFELGWKQTQNRGCNRTEGGLGENFVEAGFPSGVRKSVDVSEDADDAVIWITDMDVVASQQYSDPNREFFMAWTCGNGNIDTFSQAEAGAATFTVSTNLCSTLICGPATSRQSTSLSSLDYVPSDQAFRGFPTGTMSRHTVIDSPWTQSWSFQAGDSIDWSRSPTTAIYSVPCGTGIIRDCYGYFQPQYSGQGYQSLIVYQDFYVRTASDNLSYTAGKGKQFAGYFRCPTWAPSWAGVGQNSYCVVDIFAHNYSHVGATGFRWHIPADGSWYSVMSDAFPRSPVSETWVSLSINTNGVPVDMDGLWVSSNVS